MRLFFGLVVFFGAMVSIVGCAEAEPCAVRMNDAYLDEAAHEFVVTFSSLVDGTADVRVTLTAGDTAYDFHLPDVRFEHEASADHTSWTWHSSPSFVRAPKDAKAPSLAVVTLLDPKTKLPIACDGQRERVAPPDGAKLENLAERAGAVTPPVDAVASPATARACDDPNASARTDRVAQATYPESARLLHKTGKVFVRVELGETGSVIDANVERSSGFADLDTAARNAAIATAYRPGRFRCEPVSGAYLFQVDFTN